MVNRVTLVGRLGDDPILRHTQKGTPVCNFPVATNEYWTDPQGQRQHNKEWHRIVVWNRQAELCKQYLKKGRQAYIEGKIQTRSWEGQDGQTHYTTEIVARTVQFLGDSPNQNGGSEGGQEAADTGDPDAEGFS